MLSDSLKDCFAAYSGLFSTNFVNFHSWISYKTVF